MSADSTPERKFGAGDWAAPKLRSVVTMEGQTEEWFSECPPWCSQAGKGHEADGHRVRMHESAELAVKADQHRGWDYQYDDGEWATMHSHVAVQLAQVSRGVQPAIVIQARRPNEDHDGPSSAPRVHLYPDEARELVAVLQYWLKVAQED